jgi:hypothetical protein
MKYDKYGLKARIFPTVLGVILPIIVFNQFFVLDTIHKIFSDKIYATILGSVSLPTVFMFFLPQFARIIGKGVFEKRFFRDEFSMPTTNFLLFSNTVQYSDEYKIKIGEKIKADFDLTLSSKKQEEKNEQEARQKIVTAMSFVRKKLEKNDFLLKHNIEYGAIRNLIGASCIGLVMSIFNIFFFYFVAKNIIPFYISITLLSIYLILILSSKFLIVSFGNSYAKILIREYMTDEKK